MSNQYCDQCGEQFAIDSNGIANHVTRIDDSIDNAYGIAHDIDANHVAYCIAGDSQQPEVLTATATVTLELETIAELLAAVSTAQTKMLCMDWIAKPWAAERHKAYTEAGKALYAASEIAAITKSFKAFNDATQKEKAERLEQEKQAKFESQQGAK
jgi:hypothetical protein